VFHYDFSVILLRVLICFFLYLASIVNALSLAKLSIEQHPRTTVHL